MYFDLFNFNKNDKWFLFAVFLFSLFIVYKMIEFYMVVGIYDPDKAIYLIDALKFAGLDYYNICSPADIFYSPVICFLTSMLFRFGLIDKLAIFVVTGVIGIFGELGLYILFRKRFNQILSFTAVIIFGSLSVVLWNIGSGGIDIPSISISIWLIIFSMIAIEKNPKFFILIVPLFVIGFFTRYTVGFLLPVIFIYYLLNRDILGKFDCLFSNKFAFKDKCINYFKSDDFKYMLISVILGIILFVIICLFIFDNGGALTFLEQSTNTFNGINYSPLRVDYNPSRLYYIKNLPKILSEDTQLFNLIISPLLITILICGCLIKIKNHCVEFNFQRLDLKTKYFSAFIKIFLILSLINIFVGFMILRNHMVSNISAVIFIVCLYYFMPDNSNLKFTLLNLSWLVLTLIFASLYDIKVLRYALPFIVPLVYFIVLGLEEIIIFLKNNLKINNLNVIPVYLIIILLISSFHFVNVNVYEHHGDLGVGLRDVTDFIISNDSDFRSKVIVGDEHISTIAKWYLRTNGTMLRDYELNNVDMMDSDYVIVSQDLDFKNYHKIYSSHGVNLYAPN